MFSAKVFTEGKNPSRNEDDLGYNDRTFAVADGATGQIDKKFNGQTPGEIASEAIIDTCLSTNLTGSDLVDEINEAIQILYEEHDNHQAKEDKKFRYISSFASGTIDENEETLTITHLGDIGIRINGENLQLYPYRIEKAAEEARSNFIEVFGRNYEEGSEDFKQVLEEAREFIDPLLKEQYKVLNNPEDPLAFYKIDGFDIPDSAIRVDEYQLDSLETIELFTDGYHSAPDGVSINAWEKEYRKTEKEDPYKWKKHKATKPSDDRAILIANFRDNSPPKEL